MDNSNSDFLPMLSISKEKALKNLEEAKNYIIIDLKNIASILSSYHPLEIARMSIWESRKVERKSKDSFTRSTYRLLPILIQSVLVSDLFFASSNNRDVKNKDWQRVLSLAEDVARKLSRYIDNLTIVHLNDGLVSREDIIDYRAGLYEQYFPSEKTHDIIRRERALALASFEWDESAVEETFSVSPERLVKDLYDISDKALDVIDNLVSDVSAFKDTVEAKMAKIKENDPSLSEDGARHMAYMDASIRAENQRLSGLRDDFDLFRPEFLSSITNETMDALSSELGKVDMITLLFSQGLWSATCYPFIRLSGMYFTFVARYLLAIYQRFSSAVMHIGYMVSACADNALSSLFTATDVVDVYSFNGKKVDVVVLSSLGEINLVSSPELWQQRMKRRSIEMEAKPQLGHKMLIVNPDGSEEMEELGKDVLLTSSLYLLKVREDALLRRPFYETIFGSYTVEDGESVLEEDDIFDEDDHAFTVEEDEEDERLELEDLDDEDEYTFDPDSEEDEDDDYPDPMEVERSEMSPEERLENERMYEANHERVVSELEADVDNSQYEGVDDDELDDSQESPTEDFDDPDQLDFLDLLDEFDSDDEEDDADLEEEESADSVILEEEIDDEDYSSDYPETSAISGDMEDKSPVEEGAKESSSCIADTESEESEPQFVRLEEESAEPDILEEEIDDEDYSSDYPETSAVSDDVEDRSPIGEEPKESSSCIADAKSEDAEPQFERQDEESAEPDAVMEDGERIYDEALDEVDAEMEEIDEAREENDPPTDAELERQEDKDAVISEIEASREQEEDSVASIAQTSNEDEYLDLCNQDDGSQDEAELLELEDLNGDENKRALNAGFDDDEDGKIVLEYDDDEEDFLDSPKYSDIIRSIARKLEGEGDCFYSFLEREDESVISYFDCVIHDSWERQQADGKDKMFSVFEYDMSLLLSKGRIYDDLRLQELMNNAGAVMCSQSKNSWNALLLYINQDYVVESAKMIKLSRSSFSSSDWKIVTNIADALNARKNRV